MTAQIEVSGLGKAYTIGHDVALYRTLRDELSTMLIHPLRSMRGRKREFENLWALRDVSFEVAQGDVLGVIGRNGSGKSTLLKILSRIVAPSEGQAVLRGRVASLLEVGTGFHAELSGRENIFLNGALLGMNRVEIARNFDRIVDFAEIEKFLDTPVKFYSSGMYVRLAFSVAAHLDPDVLIVDEVLAVGDASFQRKSLAKMREVSKQGRTVLFVSHSATSILTLCNTGLYLHRGSVQLSGSVLDAVNAYHADVNAEEGAETQLSPERAATNRIWITDSQDNETHSLASGETFTLNLSAAIGERFREDDLVVSFSLDTGNGVPLASCVSSWVDAELRALDGELNVSCTITGPPFRPGRLYVTTSIATHAELLETARHDFAFEIGQGDEELAPGNGPVALSYRFDSVRSNVARHSSTTLV